MQDAITYAELVEKIQGQFGTAVLAAYETYGLLNIEIEREKLMELMRFLKESPDLNFHFMTDLCGMHYPFQRDKELGMVYMLHNMLSNVRVRIKCFVPINDASVPSMTPLWSAANWMERETFDFFGIYFEGHPDLRRILNVDDMDYFPMLKQYPLEDGTRTDKDDAMFGR